MTHESQIKGLIQQTLHQEWETERAQFTDVMYLLQQGMVGHEQKTLILPLTNDSKSFF